MMAPGYSLEPKAPFGHFLVTYKNFEQKWIHHTQPLLVLKNCPPNYPNPIKKHENSQICDFGHNSLPTQKIRISPFLCLLFLYTVFVSPKIPKILQLRPHTWCFSTCSCRPSDLRSTSTQQDITENDDS